MIIPWNHLLLMFVMICQYKNYFESIDFVFVSFFMLKFEHLITSLLGQLSFLC